MVLDPLTSISLISNVVQFVDSGCRLFSKSRELYKSSTGAFVDDTELKSVARRLEELARSAELLPSPSENHENSSGEKLLLEISKGCKEQTSKLSTVLAPLNISVAEQIVQLSAAAADPTNPARRKWDAFRVSLRRMRKSGEIDAIARKLDSYSQELSTCLMMILCDQNSATWKSLQDFFGINQQAASATQGNIQMLHETNEALQKQLKSLSEAVTSIRDRLTQNEGIATWLSLQASEAEQFNETLSNLSRWLKASQRLAARTRFLDSLSYRSRLERQSQIKDSHAKTFQWVFKSDEESSTSAKCSLMPWLEEGDGIYWLSGKAGSGKSTLMKFVSNHRRTEAALRSWAGTHQLITARFFFWNAGTAIQKSQEGLLRSILVEILQIHPNLIEEVLPPEWHSDISHMARHTSTGIWSRAALVQMCYRLARQKLVASKFCFFIDGLDEYHGEHAELVALLCDMAKNNKNVKLCLSSRPWNIFRVTFSEQNYPYLLLEELTRGDIYLYVQAHLGGNKTYRRYMQQTNPKEVYLVNEIVNKANGVFLWVYLVVRSLLRGLENEDRLSDLQHRLQMIPTDLEDYFRHMLDNIDPAYRIESAKLFDITLSSTFALTLLTFSFLDEEDPFKLALQAPIQAVTRRDIEARYRVTRKRLNARCQDLLEISTNAQVGVPMTAREAFLVGSRGDGAAIDRRFPTPDDFQIYRVDFIHRTVRDFLNAADMRETFAARLPPKFHSARWLCASFLSQLKSVPLELDVGTIRPLVITLVKNAIYFARESENHPEKPQPQTDLLDEVERATTVLCSTYDPRILDPLLEIKTFGPFRRMITVPRGSAFLAICVRMDILLYVIERLNEERIFTTSAYIDSLLICAIFPQNAQNEAREGLIEIPNLNMIQFLLDKGANPNCDLDDNETVWVHFLRYLARSWKTAEQVDQVTLLKVVKIFVEYGATVSSNRVPGTSWVKVLLMQKEIWENRGNNAKFPFLVSDVIELLISRCSSVNTTYGGCTIWGHFVNNLPATMSRRMRRRVLRTVAAFMACGADPYYDYSVAPGDNEPSLGQPNQQKGTVADRLLRLFTELELLESGMPRNSIGSEPEEGSDGKGATGIKGKACPLQPTNQSWLGSFRALWIWPRTHKS